MKKDVDNFLKNLSQKENAHFALPIISHLRSVVLSTSPTIEESIKWRQPCFSEQGLLCGIGAFKSHVNLSFFKGNLIKDHANLFLPTESEMMRTMKFYSFDDLPSNNLISDYISQARLINIEISNSPHKCLGKQKEKTPLVIPEDLAKLLSSTPNAEQNFVNFTYSKKKEYIEWIVGAKRESTRSNRLSTAVEWIAKGKSRNWKYENC